MDLLLPKDGSIVLIDDKYSEAKPLMDLLSENGYPSIYFNGDISKCPIGLKKVRAVFADIQLLPGLNDQTYAQLILDHLDKFILNNNGPYILIIWSAKLASYASKLEEMVKAPAFNKKPIAIIRLDKNDYFKKSITVNDLDQETFLESLQTRFNENDKNFILQTVSANLNSEEKREIKSDALAKISAKIRTGLKDHRAFEWLIKWEASIYESATSFVSDLASIHHLDENWDFNFKNIIARLAHAQLGEQIKKIKKKEFMRSAFKTLNSALSDSIDSIASETISISEKDLKEFSESGYSFTEGGTKYKVIWKDYSKYQLIIDDVKKGEDKKSISDLAKIVNSQTQKASVEKMISVYSGISPQLNSRLNIDTITKKPLQPGILYEVKLRNKKRKRTLLDDTYFHKSTFLGKTADKKTFLISDDVVDRFQFVELEISPNCDFANNKWKKHRVISGILFPEELRKTNSLEFQNDESLYRSFPLVKINNVVFKLVFSFKLLKSFDLTDSNEKLKKIIFRIKNEPLADIITRMTSHANRIGLIEFF